MGFFSSIGKLTKGIVAPWTTKVGRKIIDPTGLGAKIADPFHTGALGINPKNKAQAIAKNQGPAPGLAPTQPPIQPSAGMIVPGGMDPNAQAGAPPADPNAMAAMQGGFAGGGNPDEQAPGLAPSAPPVQAPPVQPIPPQTPMGRRPRATMGQYGAM